MSSQQNIRGLRSGLTLEFPQSLGVYDKYEQAQRAVDFLSDHEFPVENCMIVGTDLKRVERITGKRVDFYEADARDEGALARIFDQHPITGAIHFAALKAVGESVAKPLA